MEEQLQSKRSAAILIPILLRGDQYFVLFTRRSHLLKYHSNQICFPGGAFEQDDDTLEQTALREFEEETGLSAQQVIVLGTLKQQMSSTGFQILPFYGHVLPPYRYKINKEEVDQLIEIPLTYILTMKNFKLNPHISQLKGIANTPHIHCIEYNEFFIWGVTTSILKDFAMTNIQKVLERIK